MMAKQQIYTFIFWTNMDTKDILDGSGKSCQVTSFYLVNKSWVASMILLNVHILVLR